MDALLDRLWELANEDDDPISSRRNDRLTEAQALWRALEVLLTSLRPRDLQVGDGTFIKTLACIRSVLSDVSYWDDAIAVTNGGDDNFMSVFVCVNRVIHKLSCRGASEREALVRDGVADLIVRCGEAAEHVITLTSSEVVAALQTLQSLALDSKNRPSLQAANTIRLTISLMQKHTSIFAVQLLACQFLHQMAMEEDCKERIRSLGGLQTLTSALSRFAAEVELVVAALDVLFLLCIELDCHEEADRSPPISRVNSNVLESVVRAVLDAMRVLQSVELVQAKGVAVLKSMVMCSAVKQALCSFNIWDIAKNSLLTVVSDDATRELVELLETLLRDPTTCETLRQSLLRSSNTYNGDVEVRLKALKTEIEALHQSQITSIDSENRMKFVAARLQSLLNENGVLESFKREPLTCMIASGNEIRDGYNRYGKYVYSRMHSTTPAYPLTHTENESDDELPVDSGGNTNGFQCEDRDKLLLGKGNGYFERFLRDTKLTTVQGHPELIADVDDNRVDSLHTLCTFPHGPRVCTKVRLNSTRDLQSQDPEQSTRNSSSSWSSKNESKTLQILRQSNSVQAVHPLEKSNKETEKWQALYEASAREVQRLQLMSSELENRYRIVVRRAKEQAKLLALQNLRLNGHASEHQQILCRMQSLEISLEEAHRRCQVERELRFAESTQCEDLSLALNKSMQEGKILAVQQSSAVRELQQKEKMRTEYMIQTRETKNDKQRVESERDYSLLQIEMLKREKNQLFQQLEDCGREGRETLLMREEDIDARRPGVFDQLTRAAIYQGDCRSNPNNYMIETHRRNSLPSETLADHQSKPRSSMVSRPGLHRSASLHPIQTQVDTVLNDDPNSIGTGEIQTCLASVFQSLDTTIEGANEVGVHVSTVRRFFMESGLIQAPHLLPADVDVVLAGVLAQVQLNRKNTLERKDFTATQQTWSPPHGWAKTKKKPPLTKSMSLAGNATRFRFFNLDTFNEAVTLVAMRRFPRSDLLRVLQTVVALYFRPYMRQRQSFRQSSPNQRSRSSSIYSGINRRTSIGPGSPSQICTRAMKTILNVLALHMGRGNEKDLLRSSKSSENDGEIRCHSNPPSSLIRSHKREEVVYSMLEMNDVLSREQRPLGTICEFYSAQFLPTGTAAAAVSSSRNELFGLSFDLVLSFAIDFELIPSFMDRVTLKQLHTEVAGLLKAYFALHDKGPPSGADGESLKKVGFGMLLARLALELFCLKPGYETPEQQITGLLQWLDNSSGREKIFRKAGTPLVIRFTRQLYSVKS